MKINLESIVPLVQILEIIGVISKGIQVKRNLLTD